MKYIHEPNTTVIDYDRGKKIFQFDNNGEFSTEDETIIKFMAKYKNFIKCENKQVETVSFKCKKCDFETGNKGLLMQHYKNSHKKEGA